MEQPTGTPTRAAAAPAGLAVEAFVTLAAVIFVMLALDDITTDNSTGFRPEYTLLTLTGAWLLVLVVQLWRKGRPSLASISLIALLVAAWVSADGIGNKRDGGWSVFWPEYSVIVIAWLWFLAVAISLLRQVFRRSSPAPAST